MNIPFDKEKYLPEGPIVQGAEKSAFVRCPFVVVRSLSRPLSKQFGHFPSFRLYYCGKGSVV